MPQRTHGRNPTGFIVGTNRVPVTGRSNAPSALVNDIGPIIYFGRRNGLIKIGFTSGWLESRMKRAGLHWPDLIAIRPGTLAEEQALHQQLRPHLARGREWYTPCAEIYDLVDEIRAGYRLPPVDRTS